MPLKKAYSPGRWIRVISAGQAMQEHIATYEHFGLTVNFYRSLLLRYWRK
jgi:hypothetical protein